MNIPYQKLLKTHHFVQGYLESLKKHGDPIPPSIKEEIVDIAI